MYHLDIFDKNGSTNITSIVVESNIIPRVGETLYLGELLSYSHHDLSIFLVSDVSYSIGKDKNQGVHVQCIASSRSGEQVEDSLINKRTFLLTDQGWLSEQD
jgi:hypothetical protein